ncbi:MAG: hypothetical protein JOY54_15455 [Acidobacteriaceae bacterium]|nr:hypothetical protein [Acidobacteriaceae bacterium]
MNADRSRRVAECGLALALLLLTSCVRAPSFDIVGSFFPAWLACFTIAILLTVLSRWLLSRLQIPIAWPILAYPSLIAFFTFALWLAFFRS